MRGGIELHCTVVAIHRFLIRSTSMEEAPASRKSACKAHPMRPARAACSQCNGRICNDCYRFRLNGKPACAACAYGASTRSRRWISLAVSFAGLSLVGIVTGVRRYDLGSRHPEYLALFLIGAAIGTVMLLFGSMDKNVDVTKRLVDEEEDESVRFDGSANPYRGRVKKTLSHVAPRVSGATTAAIVAGAFVTSAVLLPATLKLPTWVEAELVIVVWWTVLTVLLTVLLVRGYRLKDDWVHFSPWERPSADETKPSTPTAKASKGSGADWGCSDGCSGIDGEGALVVLVVGAALALVFGAAWVLVEIAVPLVCVTVYAAVMRAIGRVARDAHHCEGELARSLGWGALWSSVYVMPLAVLTWLLHLALITRR